ncbi:MAG: RNA methyltransferase [Nitrospinae bacterium]|nr:RNA methyltransferase [Nitrospinota bacterium]
MNKLYIGLVHFPIYNKHHEIVKTSVTTIDVHDIARASKTFDVSRFFVITPVEIQQNLVTELILHWKDGFGGEYNPIRKKALKIAKVIDSIEDTLAEIEGEEGEKPIIIATSAQKDNLDKSKIKQIIEVKNELLGKKPTLILFGTGWGLADEVLNMSDYILEPIRGDAPFNHLPVRSAVSIYLDRLIS